jgi:hypothetical protein
MDGDVRSTIRQTILQGVLFVFIPTVFFVVALQLTKVRGPEWLGSNFDPSYMYLLNSLQIATGKAPSQFQHPGITTEIFGAACLKLSAHESSDALVSAVLAKPERFLKEMHRALVVACASAVWIFPLLTSLRTKSLVTGFLLQAPVLFYTTIFNYSTWFGSDLLLIAPSLAATSICIILIRQREQGQLSLATCVLAGAICGFGVTTKLTFFPLILITAFCCRGWRALFAFLGGFIITSTLILIPLHSQLYQIRDWIVALATHSGYYGNGEVGLPQANTYFPALARLISMEPAVALIPILTTFVIVIVRFGSRKRGTGWAVQPFPLTALAIFFLQVLSLLFIAKHAAYHYLIPLYLSTGINLVLLSRAIKRPADVPWANPLALAALGILLIAGLNALLIGTPHLVAALRYAKNEQLSIYERVKEKTRGAPLVEYYRSISPQFALYFGDNYAGRAFARQLEAKYPNALFYCIWNGLFDTFSDFVEPALITRKYGHFYYFGNINSYRSEDTTNLKFFDQKKLRDVDSQGYWTLQEWGHP